MSRFAWGLLIAFSVPTAASVGADIDATTLHHKVLCGYQGWFRCPGDPAEEGWVHWSRDRKKITPESLTFEMWPDMSELGADEKYPAPGFTYPDGKPADLFSSANAKTVERHFEWMREYGVDGVFATLPRRSRPQRRQQRPYTR